MGDLDHGHFVIEGTISLIYRLNVLENTDRYGNRNFKLSNNTALENSVDHYIEASVLSSEACFNIGMNTKYVI